METPGETPQTDNVDEQIAQQPNRRNLYAGLAGFLAVAVVASMAAAKWAGGEDAASAGDTSSTPVAGATQTPGNPGVSEVPTKRAEPLSPTTLPTLPTAPNSAPGVTVTGTGKPPVVAKPTATARPSATETAPAPAAAEKVTPGGFTLVPFQKDTPELRKGKTLDQLIEMYEIPVQLTQLDNQPASIAEARRAFKEYMKRLTAWRSMTNNVDWNFLYNSNTNEDAWMKAMPELALSIFPAALSGDELLKDPRYQSTVKYYQKFTDTIMKSDLVSYSGSLNAINDGYFGGKWAESGPFLGSFAYKISPDTPVIVGAINGQGYYRVDAETVDINSAPQADNSNYNDIPQRTPESVDARAEKHDKHDTGAEQLFMQVGIGRDGKTPVWHFSVRQ